MDYLNASFVRRFIALLVDYVILKLTWSLITFPFAEKYEMRMDDILESLMSGKTEDFNQIVVFLLIYSTVLTLFWGVYFVYFIGSAGQTPGKKLLGIQVVRADEPATEMDYKTAFNRFAGYTLSAGLFFLGFLWALFDSRKQTWHDKIAKTIVVKLTPS